MGKDMPSRGTAEVETSSDMREIGERQDGKEGFRAQGE